MVYLLILFILLAGALFMRLLYLQHALHIMQEQLKKINSGWSQSELRLPDNDRLLQALAEEGNRLIKALQLHESTARQLSMTNRQLMASIAHDFRTPLTSIVGYVQLLQEGDLSAQQRSRYFSIIEKRLQNLSELIEDFYMQSLVDAAEYPLKESKLYPVALLQNILALYYEDLEQVFAELDVNLVDERHFMRGDKVALERIYSNLIKNCLLHGLHKLSVSTAICENNLLIRLENEVENLPEHFEPAKLFERNFRLLAKRAGFSSGLGLSIARGLINSMGGELCASLKHDAEADAARARLCFQLRLPLSGQDESPALNKSPSLDE